MPKARGETIALQEFAYPLDQQPHLCGGRLIAVDGVDGSGKSSLVEGLVDELRHRGIAARGVDMMSSWVRRHPQFMELAADLENLISHRADITALCAICIGDRLAAWRTRFRELVAQGEWLIVDRYHLTPMSDMLVLGSEQADQLMVRSLLSLLPRPDWAFLADVNADTALARVRSRPEEADRTQRPELTSQLVAAFRCLADVHAVFTVSTSGNVSDAVMQAMSRIES